MEFHPKDSVIFEGKTYRFVENAGPHESEEAGLPTRVQGAWIENDQHMLRCVPRTDLQPA